MSAGVLVVFSTFGDAEEARRVGRQLVEERLAACANLVPAIESIYWWEGAVQNGAETLVVFKTTDDRFAAFEQRLRELHSYEVPEVIASPIERGSHTYLQW